VRISVVIPTYNRARLLERALGSVLSQSRLPDEILVVDDGSTDDTREVVGRFAPVTYLRQENAGASAARNYGASVARGDFIAFLDSDDVWFPDFLERMENAIQATAGQAVIYFADLAYTEIPESAWELSGLTIPGEYELREEPSSWFMLPIQPMTTQSSLIRRDAYQALGGQHRALVLRHDTHLFFLLGFAGPACAVACVAGTLTSDGGEARLTSTHHSKTASYLQDTVLMYRDVLGRCTNIATGDRRELRERLALAHLRLSRLAWQERRMRDCLVAFKHSLRCSRRTVAERAASRMRAWISSRGNLRPAAR